MKSGKTPFQGIPVSAGFQTGPDQTGPGVEDNMAKKKTRAVIAYQQSALAAGAGVYDAEG